MHFGMELRALTNRVDKMIHYHAKNTQDFYLLGPQGIVLAYLMSANSRPIYQRDIEQHLSISKSSASALINRMEKQALISTQTSKVDERLKEISITRCGKEKFQSIQPLVNQLHQQMLSGIDPQELAICEKVIGQITDNLNKLLEKGECPHVKTL